MAKVLASRRFGNSGRAARGSALRKVISGPETTASAVALGLTLPVKVTDARTYGASRQRKGRPGVGAASLP